MGVLYKEIMSAAPKKYKKCFCVAEESNTDESKLSAEEIDTANSESELMASKANIMGGYTYHRRGQIKSKTNNKSGGTRKMKSGRKVMKSRRKVMKSGRKVMKSRRKVMKSRRKH
jgi:hypothetical protein